MGKIVAIISGIIVGGFVSTLWVFHVFFSGSGKTDPTLPTLVYIAMYLFFSFGAYKTFLRGAVRSFEETFVFFCFIPGVILGLLWWILLVSGIL